MDLTKDKTEQSLMVIGIESIENFMLQEKQEEVPVYHHFGPKVYIREVRLKKDTIAVGHYQKNAQMNVMITGKVSMFTNDGIKTVSAPLIYVGEPGRKIGQILEDTVWPSMIVTGKH